VEDIQYVQGYFKTGVNLRTPNINCMKSYLEKALNSSFEYSDPMDLNNILEKAYQFCISETDFGDITPQQYLLLRNISTTLAENTQDFYILNDAQVMSQVGEAGQTFRVEPMKTLAEASTSGKKTSSNIEKVGYFNNMLEVEFKSGDHYIYFVEPDFYDQFVSADSKGEFLWDTLRGKKVGLVWGYATGTGSKMKYTPGGVGGSLVPYSKGTSGAPEFEPRMPTEKERELMQKEIQIQFLGKGLKYKETAGELGRQETLTELRGMFGSMPKSKGQKKITNPNKLPAHERYIDFEGIPVITDKSGSLEDFGVCEKRYELLHDFYHMDDEKERDKLQKIIKKYDINIKDDTTLKGVITRAGAFDYGGHIKHKKWENLLENAVNHPVLPVFGSRYTNPHKEENIPHLIGYVDSWEPDHEKQWLYGKIHTFEPIAKLTDLDNPKDIQVSLSMFDSAPDNSEYQDIVGFRNVAVALNNQLDGRCDSVDGYGSCVVNPIQDINTQVNNLSQIIIKKPTGSSGSETGARKIIKKKSDLYMPDEKEVKEEIAKMIADFKAKQTDDSLAVTTGNEVAGHTLYDEFIRTMLDDGHSPSAAEKAWKQYNAQNKPASGEVDPTTLGFQKTVPGLSGDFEEKLDSLIKTVTKQESLIKKYEDFFSTEQKKIEGELKNKYKKPLSEENQEIIEKLDFDTLEKVKPILDIYLKEHPEIIPTDKSADEIGDLNTNEILKRLGKTKEDLRKTKDDMTKMKEGAIERMKAKWSKGE